MRRFRLTPSLYWLWTRSDKIISNLILGHIQLVSMVDGLNLAETMEKFLSRIKYWVRYQDSQVYSVGMSNSLNVEDIF